mmetsp:Transcript_14511/g.36790  ORF Transcript_14511/g.36790 Transcript_14511/m.36790 type:complete len:477 (-) Transcript_14511:479-1909(-)
MASTPSFFLNSLQLLGLSLQRPAKTEAQSWRLVIGLSLSAKSSTSRPTAPRRPSSSAKCGPMRTATWSKFKHFFCTSRLLVACNNASTVALPCASMKASGTYCTSWNNAERASSCTFRRCSWLHWRCSGGTSCASKTASRDGTKPQRTATWAQASAEQHRAKVPQRSIRNSMSSCEFVSATDAVLLWAPPLLLPAFAPKPAYAGRACSCSPSSSLMTPVSWRTFLLASPTACPSSSAMSPELAKSGRFSSRLEMYINNTIMSLRKILSLKRYPRERTASIKSLKHSMTSSWPSASAAPCQSNSKTFHNTSAATSSTSEPNKFTRITWTKFDISPLLVICLASGRYSDMSRMAPRVITMASGLSSALKDADSASITCDCLRIRKFGVPESATACISGWCGLSSTLSSSSPKRDQHASVCATSILILSLVAFLSSSTRRASGSSAEAAAAAAASSSEGGRAYDSTPTRILIKLGRKWP